MITNDHTRGILKVSQKEYSHYKNCSIKPKNWPLVRKAQAFEDIEGFFPMLSLLTFQVVNVW